MTKKPTASVAIITRTKDRPIMLARAIASVTEQTFTDWRMVIVNDGGAKEPVDMLVEKRADALDGRVTVIHHKTSKGMEAASNAGLNAGEGTYVVIHDDDDSWEPDFLEKAVAYLEESSPEHTEQGVICYSRRILEVIEGNIIRETKREDFNQSIPNVNQFWRIAGQNTFPPISFLYRRSVFEKIGGMYDEKLPVLGDWEFNLRFLQHFDIGLIPETLANYHHREEKNSVYANSVHGARSAHETMDTRIRNRFLREDIASGKSGMGFVVNASRQLLDQDRREPIRDGNLMHALRLSTDELRTQSDCLARDHTDQLTHIGERVEETFDRAERTFAGLRLLSAPFRWCIRGISHLRGRPTSPNHPEK